MTAKVDIFRYLSILFHLHYTCSNYKDHLKIADCLNFMKLGINKFTYVYKSES